MSPFQIALIALLGVFLVTLIVVATSVRMPQVSVIELSVDGLIDGLNEATSHYVDVNAVLALTSTFEENPDLSSKLAGYSRQVVDAALLHRVNSLGNDLREVDLKLSKARSGYANNTSPAYDYARTIKVLEGLRNDLQAQLDAANDLIQERGAAI